MLSKTMEVLAKSIGLKIGQNNIYGIYGNFFLTVSETKSKKKVEISCFIGNNEDYSEDYMTLTEGIRDVLERYSITDYSVNENCVTIVSNAALSQFREMIDYILGLLDENDIPDSHYCSCCGEQFKDGEKRRVVTLTSSKNETKSLLCEKCALNAADQAQQTSETPTDNIKPDTAKGTVISLLTGLLVGVIYVLLFSLTGLNSRDGLERFAPCFFAFFIGGMVYLIYKIFAKRVDKKGIIVTCILTSVITVISHCFACIVGFGSYVSKNFGLNFDLFGSSFKDYFLIQFTDGKNINFFIIGSVIALCSAFIALILLQGSDHQKSNTNESVIVSIQTVK